MGAPAEVRTLVVSHRGHTTAHELRPGALLHIGRSSSCEVFLDDAQVSRRHAIVRVGPDGLSIEDLGSHNGTHVVATEAEPTTGDTATQGSTTLRLTPQVVTALPDGAMIQIGSALITVRVASQSPRGGRTAAGVIVVAPAMRQLFELADRVAPTNLSVLLLGESGAGKEVLAQHLHHHSPRASHRLVTLNCGALPEHLLESELFGHEKGAFTGAAATKPGLFEAAEGGTLFLDEIGEMPLALQVKLLRVLEDRKVTRVGAIEPRTIDVRFVAATNRDPEAEIAGGRFRQDLYYRLNGITLHLPPLRERRAEIVPLAERFLADLAPGAGRAVPVLSRAAADALTRHDWPGNIRQLKNVIHRALVLATGSEISEDDIVLGPQDRSSTPTIDQPISAASAGDDPERRKILEALDACAGNQTRAAQLLGITRRVLVRRLDKFQIARPRDRGDD